MHAVSGKVMRPPELGRTARAVLSLYQGSRPSLLAKTSKLGATGRQT
jgi:hypothetical protein